MKLKSKIILILFFSSFNLFAQNKVLIVWYGMGKGHLIPAERIAEYVKQSFKKRSEPVEVKLIDLREYSISDSISEETGKRKYLDWAGKEAESYTQYFEWYLEKNPKEIQSNFDLYRLSKMLVKEKPNAIITVFWGASHAFYLLKQMYPETFKTPVSLLYTDYGVRKFVFMVPTIEKIFFGSQKMVPTLFNKYPQLIFFGKNFDFSGIPVNIDRIMELRKENIQTIKTSLGLNSDSPIVTFARGGEVFLPMAGLMEKALNKVSVKGKNIQVVLLAGKAARDREELGNLEKKYPGKVKVVGFIDNNTYLAYVKASNVLVTKPGGAGLTEAGLTGVPTIIIPGLGGQEEDNQKQFVASEMAYFEKEDDAIIEKISLILKDPKVSLRMRIKQMEFFKDYDPSKIAEWAFAAKGSSDWDKLRDEIEKRENKKLMQDKITLDPITLKNWFNYLNDVSLSDIGKDRSFQKIFREKAQIYINEAIKVNQGKIEKYKNFLADFKGSLNRDYYIKKWKLFRAIILDHALHINLNQAYVSPNRALLDQLTSELLQFLDTDIFAKDLGVYSIWEFKKGSLYTFLAEFFYLSKFLPKAQENLNLAFKEFPPNNTNESLIMLQANLLLRLKKNKQAIDSLKKYLQANQDYDHIRVNLAKILNDENQVKEALDQCQWLLNKRKSGTLPLSANAYFMMATIYLKNNLKPDALNILLQGMEAHPKSIVLVSLAIRLISGDEKLKSQNEARLAQLIDKYKSLKEMELKNLENLPLLIEESSPVGKEGLMSF